MNKTVKIFSSLALMAIMLIPVASFAGNPNRVGTAGATELLINPWARSSGWAGANTAGAMGLEAQFLNVAGMAHTRRTELLFTRTNWLAGTDIFINSFGFSQKAGATGVIGLGIMAMDFGDIPITTVDLPEGGIGTFSPQFMNLGLSYAKGFSDNIFGGITARVISESIADVSARGMALDAGIQYITGPLENIKFGIALRNVGPRMRFRGDGLSFRTPVPNGVSEKTLTVEQRSAEFEIPSFLNIGGAYDIYMMKDSAGRGAHRITIAANFTSNSFSKDEIKVGLEYGFKQYMMLRGGYSYEEGINQPGRTSAFTGPTAGFTLELPFGEDKKSTFGLDYSYRFTNPFNGTHCFGARLNL